MWRTRSTSLTDFHRRSASPTPNRSRSEFRRRFPTAKVVKTLNTVTAAVMVNPSLVSGDHDVFVSGNDAAAKAQVTKLLRSFGWRNGDRPRRHHDGTRCGDGASAVAAADGRVQDPDHEFSHREVKEWKTSAWCAICGIRAWRLSYSMPLSGEIRHEVVVPSDRVGRRSCCSRRSHLPRARRRRRSRPHCRRRRRAPAPTPSTARGDIAVDSTRVPAVKLAEAPRDWQLLDVSSDRVAGISAGRAERELLAGKQPKKTVIVAVIDGGVDTAHVASRRISGRTRKRSPATARTTTTTATRTTATAGTSSAGRTARMCTTTHSR